MSEFANLESSENGDGLKVSPVLHTQLKLSVEHRQVWVIIVGLFSINPVCKPMQ